MKKVRYVLHINLASIEKHEVRFGQRKRVKQRTLNNSELSSIRSISLNGQEAHAPRCVCRGLPRREE